MAENRTEERAAGPSDLAQSEERFRSTFEQAAVGMAHVDLRGRWMRVNPRLCEIIGCPAEELLGGAFQDITPADDVEREVAFARQLVRGEITSYSLEKRYVRPVQGGVLWIDLTVSLSRPACGGGERYFVCVMTDITARKIAEDEVRALTADLEERVLRRTAELEAANRELEAFSYSVSHDLRAPLRRIDGFRRILVEDHAECLCGEAQRHLSRIGECAERMGALIDDLLRLARVARAEMHPREVDISAMARAIAGDLRRSHPERQVEWRVGEGIKAHGDANLLHIALANLLDNAWKYTRQREEAHIEVDAFARGGETVYYVRDDGAGFDPVHAEKLFQAFQRLHAAEDFEGSGVGLAIVERILARHGGRVWAEAEPESGATFYFTVGR